MEWVKSKVGYYRHIAIATGSDALEVMFKRGDALAGEIGQDGFIPDAMLVHLVRRPAQAKKLASELVKAGLWDKVRGGYQIVDFADINAELIRLTQRKRADRDRKRAEREAARGQSDNTSVDMSTDSPQDSPGDPLYAESKSQSKSAAAAASNPPDTTTTGRLTPAVEILRAALEAAKLDVRWDTLTVDQVTEIDSLVDLHGDGPLVKAALHAYQPSRPPVYATAWLNGWRHLRAPGTRPQLVSDPCDQPGHSGTTRHCAQCASEQKAAR